MKLRINGPGIIRNVVVIVITGCLFVSFLISIPLYVKASPEINDDTWSDTFDDALGVESSYNVDISNGNVSLEGYRNDFEQETLGQIPENWVKEISGGSANLFDVMDHYYEPGQAVWIRVNDDASLYNQQKIYIEFSNYFKFFEFELTLHEISSANERQGYFFIEFFNITDTKYHEVRYYWDDARSGTPSSSSSLTAVDWGFVLPTGTKLGVKYNISENISEDIDSNPSADLTSILSNVNKMRYGFYADAGSGWDRWEQIYFDDFGLYNENYGNSQSDAISLPLGLDWFELNINKTEPYSETQINISILDGVTNEVISGFEFITDSLIDISGIDPITHPSIKIQTNFIGIGNSTPVLHDYEISWANIRPPAEPSGLVVSNPLNGYSLILSWNSNIELDLDHYKIYYSTDNVTFNWLNDVPGGTISFIHYGLTTGTTHYYMIVAVDTASNYSPNSTIVSGIPDIDSDLDGIGNIPDPDDDNDGIPDFSDPYPLNPLNDMETKIDDIQSILSGLNLTDLLIAIDDLNQTLPSLVDDLNNALANFTDINTSGIMNYLKGLNATLYNELQSILTEITNDISEMMSSLKMLESNLTSQHNALNSTIDILKNIVQNEHTQTRSEILAELNNALALLMNLDSNMTTHDSDIKNLINALDNLIQNENGLTRDQLIDNATEILNQLQIVDQDIINEIATLDTSISGQLTDLLNNMTSSNDALRTWLDLVLSSIDSNLNNTRITLLDQLDELNTTIANFYDGLNGDLVSIGTSIQQHDDDTGQDHSDIITHLNDLLNNDDLQSQDLSTLKTILTNLAGDLSGHNQSIANDIMDVVANINEFEVNAESQMEDIETTLDDLAKLENIIDDLEALNQSLGTMNKDLEESIEDKSKEEEIEDRVKFVEMLMMIVIILLIVNLIMTLVMGMRKRSQKDNIPQEERPKEEMHYPQDQTPEMIQEKEIQDTKPPMMEDKVFPPPPPE